MFAPTTLCRAIDKLGFVQADPIRAPARAQDLTLRHRVLNYRAGDLERLYAKLALEEAGLVHVEQEGRERWYVLEAKKLQRVAGGWLRNFA